MNSCANIADVLGSRKSIINKVLHEIFFIKLKRRFSKNEITSITFMDIVAEPRYSRGCIHVETTETDTTTYELQFDEADSKYLTTPFEFNSHGFYSGVFREFVGSNDIPRGASFPQLRTRDWRKINTSSLGVTFVNLTNVDIETRFTYKHKSTGLIFREDLTYSVKEAADVLFTKLLNS